MKSPIRWAGSKAQLLPTLANYWIPSSQRYVEPFCGSASLFFSLAPKAALLTDLNAELIGAWRQLRHSCEVVLECLQRLPLGSDNYYKIRQIDPGTLSPNEAAARFIYLNRFCFNGLYRTNRDGKFNVPFGSKPRVSFDIDAIRDSATLLKNAEILNSDFQAIVASTRKGDFLYVDPPYATTSTRIFNGYGKDVFTPSDLTRLFACLNDAASRGVNFVLSYADVPEVVEFGSIWNMTTVSAKRNIAGFSGARRRVSEVMISNIESNHA